MKKILLLFTLLLLLVIAPSTAKASSPLFSLEDVTVSFSPEGYMPKAKCDVKELSSLISYVAIDTSTSSPVSLPLTSAGTYQVFASFQGNEKHEKAEASAFVTITPVEAKIITDYKTVAYSRMENPVKYKISPEWAEEYLDVSIDYFPIESQSSFPTEKINVPTDLGLYYTVFNVKSNSAGVICENKYMIYEIAAYRGKKLSSKERSASVPESFKCTFQNINTVYNQDTPAVPQYSLSPVAISGKVLYKQSYSDGTYSPYTETPPIAPGEYICSYFLDNTCIGEGKIFIDKKELEITIKNETVEYAPEGITPKAEYDATDVPISFTAFALDENGAVTMEEVSVPIKKCGKYYVIAYPKDTEYFKRTYSYGYIEITPSTPEITITETEFIYDGKEKNIGIAILPSEVSYSVDYYEWEDRNSKVSIISAPSRVGKYLAVITTDDSSGNYISVSKTAIIYIDEAKNITRLSKTDIIILTVSGAVLTAVILSLIFFISRFIRKRRYPRF